MGQVANILFIDGSISLSRVKYGPTLVFASTALRRPIGYLFIMPNGEDLIHRLITQLYIALNKITPPWQTRESSRHSYLEK